MVKCEYCGKEVMLPYECKFCGRHFCVEHRLPESHNCPNLPPRSPLRQWKLKETLKSKTAAKKRMASEGELHFIREPIKEKEVEKPKPKGKLKYLIPIFCIVLISVGYVSYSFGYGNGSSASYRAGYNSGYNNGYANGNLTGYELGYAGGNLSGYALGYEVGYLDGVIDGAGTGYNIRDPTYQEMLNFIALDSTDENEYSENYTCFHFTADVKNHAFQAGYKCGFVYIEFPDSAHAIVCFNTTDQGLIFIEPQSDEIVTLTIGQPYWDRTEYSPTYNDTVISFTIIW